MFLARYLNRFLTIRQHDTLSTDLETSEAKGPNSAGTETVAEPVTAVTDEDATIPQDLTIPQDPVIPRGPVIPHDIIYEVLDHVATDSNSRLSLRSCSLVSRSWIAPCRRHLFHTLFFKLRDTFKWLEAFPAPEQSPARHVRCLRLSLQGHYYVPEEFFRRIQGFTEVKEITMSVDGDPGQSWWLPSWVRLPQSVTSLTLNGNSITVLEIRDVMAQLPNLNDLSLSGSLRGQQPQGIGTVLKGKFGGRLQLHKLESRSYAGVVDMLLEVPTGLHFTELDVLSVQECLLTTVRLAEACGKSLAKLSYAVHNLGKHRLLPLLQPVLAYCY